MLDAWHWGLRAVSPRPSGGSASHPEGCSASEGSSRDPIRGRGKGLIKGGFNKGLVALPSLRSGFLEGSRAKSRGTVNTEYVQSESRKQVPMLASHRSASARDAIGYTNVLTNNQLGSIVILIK